MIKLKPFLALVYEVQLRFLVRQETFSVMLERVVYKCLAESGMKSLVS